MLPQFIPALFSLFSFAPKHSERFREPDIEEAVVNRGFLAPIPEEFANALQRSDRRAVCWPGAF
jgi:hypothetical protein